MRASVSAGAYAVPEDPQIDWRALAPDPEWLESVADQIAAYLRQEMPELPTELDGPLRDSTLANAQQYADALRNGADLRSAEPPLMAIELVRLLVQRGVSLRSLAKIFRLGQVCFWEQWSARLRESIDDQRELAVALEESSRFQFAMAEVVVGRTLDRFADERDRWVRSSAAVRTATISELLANPAGVDIKDASLKLGYELDRWHLGFVLALPGAATGSSTVTLEHLAAELSARLGCRAPVLHHIGTRALAGWVGAWERPEAPDLGGPFGTLADSPYIALGSAEHGAVGFRRSHQQALATIRVARLIGSRPAGIMAHDDVAMLCLASSDLEAAREFVARELCGLAAKDDQTQRVASTLRVYLEEGTQARRTAARLGIHANTVGLRLRTAEDLLGRPVTFRLVETALALSLLSVVHGSEEQQA
jgi:DNA-binding PucR family transcriptional regulator